MKRGFIGKGDNACVIADDMLRCSAVGNVSTTMITRIAKNSEEWRNEVAMASMLSKVDKEQEYLIYPAAWCIIQMTQEIKEQYAKYEAKCGMQLSRDGRLYLTELKHGGKSLEVLQEAGGRILTGEQAEQVWSCVLSGLALLHVNNMSHGDVHHGNITIQVDDESNTARAFLIDIGGSGRTMHDDMKDLVKNVLSSILRITDAKSEFYRWMKRIRGKLEKKSAHLDIHRVQQVVDDLIEEEKQRETTRGSSPAVATMSPDMMHVHISKSTARTPPKMLFKQKKVDRSVLKSQSPDGSTQIMQSQRDDDSQGSLRSAREQQSAKTPSPKRGKRLMF